MRLERFFEPEGWLSPTGGPRYLQLRRHLLTAIKSGAMEPETPLPPEREIAAMTGLSRVTVRKAMGALADEGLITQRRGSGSFVSDRSQRVEQSLSALTSFTEDMALRGMVVHSKWIERGLFLPTAKEIEVLQLDEDSSVARLSRVRSADGVPLAIERAALSPRILPNPLMVETSLYEVLGQSGNRPVRAIQRISATNLNDEDSLVLNVDPGVAGLKIERTSFLEDGRVVEFTQSIYRGDKYDFVAQLQLSERERGRPERGAEKSGYKGS